MALRLGAERVVSIERNPEIMAAMRQLGEEDWSDVQMVVGDWLEQRPELHAAFNCIVCDAAYCSWNSPDSGSDCSKLVHGYLAPGGVFVAKEWAEPAGDWDYEAMKRDLIQTFERQSAEMDNGQMTKAFSFLASELRLAAFIGMICEDGTFAQESLVARLDHLVEELEKRFPDPELVAITHAALKYLARSQPGTTDTVAGVRYDGAEGAPLKTRLPMPGVPLARCAGKRGQLHVRSPQITRARCFKHKISAGFKFLQMEDIYRCVKALGSNVVSPPFLRF